MTTSDASLTALVAEVKAALRARKIPGATGHLALKWLGALVQAVEDLREKLGRANEQNQYCHDNHSPGQQMVIESQTQQLHDIRLEVAQLRADGQRLTRDLLKFGDHLNSCDSRRKMRTGSGDTCSCGFLAALAVGDAP